MLWEVNLWLREKYENINYHSTSPYITLYHPFVSLSLWQVNEKFSKAKTHQITSYVNSWKCVFRWFYIQNKHFSLLIIQLENILTKNMKKHGALTCAVLSVCPLRSDQSGVFAQQRFHRPLYLLAGFTHTLTLTRTHTHTQGKESSCPTRHRLCFRISDISCWPKSLSKIEQKLYDQKLYDQFMLIILNFINDFLNLTHNS